MVSQSKNGFHYIVSQSLNGFPKYGFSIIKWKTIYFSKNGFPKYGFSIKKWFPSRGSQSFYGTHLVVSITFMKYNDLYVFSNI